MHPFITHQIVYWFVLPVLFVALAATSAPAGKMNGDAAEDAAVEEVVAAILEVDGDMAYGQFLAGECITCHQETGRAEGIPAIVGIEKDYFVRSIVEYQTNVRENEVMRLHVQNLGDEEVAALAAYFTTLDPQ